MNRLELYISKSAREFKTLVDINGSSDGRSALSDMRAVVAAVDYPTAAKEVFYAVVNVRGGYMIHVLRTIPPTRPYHLDATIFVPAGIDVMAEDIEDVMAHVTEKVMASSVTEDDIAQLREILDQEYDERDRKVRIKASSGSQPAVMRYDDNGGWRTLSDIIADGLYRPEWSGYKAVLLLESGQAVMPGAAVDLDDDSDDYDEDEEVVKEPTAPKNKIVKLLKERLEKKVYTFDLPMETPDGRTTLEFEVECSKPITRSPIPGFAIKGRVSDNPEKVNHLRRVTPGAGESLLNKLKWLGIGLVAGIIIMTVVNFTSSDDKKSDTASDPVPVEQPVEATKAKEKPAKKAESKKENVRKEEAKKEDPGKDAVKAVTEPTEATRYLDAHRVWKRDEMEKIEGLQGLYDDLNSFRYERITDEWSKKLAASKSFGSVAKAVRQAVGKKSDPRRDAAHNPNYNNKGETSINWLVYTYWIDP